METQTKYVRPNFFIPEGVFDELREALSCLSCEEVVLLAEEMCLCGQTLVLDSKSVTVDDIEAIEGSHKPCGETRLYWFHAGPEREGDKPFVTLKGTLLNWITDAVLLQLSYEGYRLLKRLRLPL